MREANGGVMGERVVSFLGSSLIFGQRKSELMVEFEEGG